MRAVVQRVKQTTLRVDGREISQIPFGLTVFLGVKEGDSKAQADYLMKKIAALRIFEDDNGRMNRSVKDIEGKVLLVPQFTLYAHTKKNRPSFHKALNPEDATELFDYFTNQCSESVDVETGEFGAYMKVSLLNNGPVTILLEKEFED